MWLKSSSIIYLLNVGCTASLCLVKFLSVKETLSKGNWRLSKGPLGLEEGEGEGRGWIMDVRDGSREPERSLGETGLLKF